MFNTAYGKLAIANALSNEKANMKANSNVRDGLCVRDRRLSVCDNGRGCMGVTWTVNSHMPLRVKRDPTLQISTSS